MLDFIGNGIGNSQLTAREGTLFNTLVCRAVHSHRVAAEVPVACFLRPKHDILRIQLVQGHESLFTYIESLIGLASYQSSSTVERLTHVVLPFDFDKNLCQIDTWTMSI